VRTELRLEASARPAVDRRHGDPAHNPQGNSAACTFKDSANTDIIFHNGKLLATWYLCGAPYAPSRRHSTPSEPRTSRAPSMAT